MKKGILSISLLGGLLLTSCSTNALALTKQSNNSIRLSETVQDNITIEQFAAFLSTKNEHYPLSDEFIERYQQTSGGYLTYANQLDVTKNKYLDMPNQKWHFFTSWLDQCVMEDPSVLQQNYRNRYFNLVTCPELLLWTYEACGVEHSKLIQILELEERGKVEKTNISTTASTIRNTIIDWESIENSIRQANITPTYSKHQVSIKESNGIEIVNLDTTGYKLGDKVDLSFSNLPNGKEVESVSFPGSSNYIKQNENGSFYFYMPNRDIELTLTLKDSEGVKIIGVESNLKLNIGESKTLVPSLNQGSGTFIYSSSDSTVASVNNNGVVNGLKEGTCKITITCNEDASISKVVDVSIIDLSNLEDFSTKYNVVYTMSGSRAVSLDKNSDILNLLELNSGNDVIDEISSFTAVAAGGNGGSGDTAWKLNNCYRLGSTSNPGYITFNLKKVVNKVVITGYAYSTSTKIRIGDSSSIIWDDEPAEDNKTLLYSCKDIGDSHIVGLTNITANTQATLSLEFKDTNSLRIATTSKNPFYITSIEFIYETKTN